MSGSAQGNGRYAVKSATLKFGSTTFDMETGIVMKPESRDAVETTSLADTIKRFIKGALKEQDEFTLPIYMKGSSDITVDDTPATVEIGATLEDGETEDVSLTVKWNKCIITKVAPSQLQASSDRKALYDVTFRPDGSPLPTTAPAPQNNGGTGAGTGDGAGAGTGDGQ